MATFLWDKIVFGPIHSRRVGTSLGINISSTVRKTCSFDCVYCECGGIGDKAAGADCSAGAAKACCYKGGVPCFTEVASAIETRFSELASQGVHIDSISFTGNGEPTLHRDFAAIIAFTLTMRDKYLPGAVVSVFSNAQHLTNPDVVAALRRVDNAILKLDAAVESTYQRINRPSGKVTAADVIAAMKAYGHDFVMQSMFFASVNPSLEGNMSAADVMAWQEAVLDIRPAKVMVYTIDRDTPEQGLLKATHEELLSIAKPLIDNGLNVEVI